MIYVYDQSASNIMGVIEDAVSIVWVEKYQDYGTFELELPYHYKDTELILMANILRIDQSDIWMVVEEYSISDTTLNTSIVLTGRSVDSKMASRMIFFDEFHQYTDAGLLLGWMIRTHITEPIMSNRTIPIFALGLRGLPTLPDFIPYGEYQKGFITVGQLFIDVCTDVGYGFRALMIFGDVHPLKMELYRGIDRSDQQYVNDWVVFDMDFDNVVSQKIAVSKKGYANAVHVISDDAVHNDFWVTLPYSPAGYFRNEISLDTTIDRTQYDPVLTDNDTLDVLTRRANALLKRHKLVDIFEGDVILDGQFKYGEHFTLGDFITVNKRRMLVIEKVFTESVEGIRHYLVVETT